MQQLASSLENRLTSRSRSDLLQTLKFLKTHPAKNQAIIAIELNTVKYTLASLAERLNFSSSCVSEEKQPVNTAQPGTTSMSEKLEIALQGDDLVHVSPLSTESLIQKEMEYYCATGEKGSLGKVISSTMLNTN